MAAAVGVKKCNIDKAIQKRELPPAMRPVRAGRSSTRSERAEADAAAVSAMGMACVRVEERAMAACGLLSEAETSFEEYVECGGVLCALPALAANGLFEHLPLLNFSQDGGFYYRLTHVFILLALMALRRDARGEFGKLLGLDRVPEGRCLRERLGSVASNPAAVAAWADALSKPWMEADRYIHRFRLIFDRTGCSYKFVEEMELAERGTLPAEHKFERLNPTRKLALDTVRMIAYRAETAIAAMAGAELSSPDEARSIVKAMFNTTVNLHPDIVRKKLRVVLHPLTKTQLNKMAEVMLIHLNEAKFTYPGTELQMAYEILMPMSPSG